MSVGELLFLYSYSDLDGTCCDFSVAICHGCRKVQASCAGNGQLFLTSHNLICIVFLMQCYCRSEQSLTNTAEFESGAFWSSSGASRTDLYLMSVLQMRRSECGGMEKNRKCPQRTCLESVIHQNNHI